MGDDPEIKLTIGESQIDKWIRTGTLLPYTDEFGTADEPIPDEPIQDDDSNNKHDEYVVLTQRLTDLIESGYLDNGWPAMEQADFMLHTADPGGSDNPVLQQLITDAEAWIAARERHGDQLDPPTKPTPPIKKPDEDNLLQDGDGKTGRGHIWDFDDHPDVNWHKPDDDDDKPDDEFAPKQPLRPRAIGNG